MKLKELSREIKKLDIPDGIINLEGGRPSDAYCIDRIGKIFGQKKWEVYYSEKGGKYDSVLFESEDKACEYLYAIAKRIEGTYRKRASSKIKK